MAATQSADDLLANVAWESLSGTHSRHAVGTARAKRLLRGFPAFAGFADMERPAVDDLLAFCDRGETLYSAGWSGAVPAGWRVDFESVGAQYVWEGGPIARDHAPEAVRLGADHVEAMLGLADLTRPGPFGPRNIDLGEYFGFFEGERLVAMTGERLAAGRMREVSAVCTHPDFQGRGLARRLMQKVMARQMARGETPFLHVMSNNARARGLYERMGFRLRRDLVLRALTLA